MAESMPAIRSPTCPAPKPGSLFDQCPANYSFTLLAQSQFNNLVDGIYGSASNLMTEGSLDVGDILMAVARVAFAALLAWRTINHRHREEWVGVVLTVVSLLFTRTQLAFDTGNKQYLYDALYDHGYVLLSTAVHFGLSWWFSTLRLGDRILLLAVLVAICTPTPFLFYYHGGFPSGEMTS